MLMHSLCPTCPPNMGLATFVPRNDLVDMAAMTRLGRQRQHYRRVVGLAYDRHASYNVFI